MSWNIHDEQGLKEWLRRLDAADRSAHPRDALRVRTLSALEGIEPSPRPLVLSTIGSGAVRRWRVAAALICALLLVVAAAWWRGPQPPASSALDAVPAAESSVVERPAVPDSKEAAIGRSRPVVVESSRPPRQQPAPSTNEPGAFVPIVPSWDEEGAMQMMRVRMTSSALRAFGIPVDVSYGDRELHADVLVGEDGVARAIRFVRDGENDRGEGRFR